MKKQLMILLAFFSSITIVHAQDSLSDSRKNVIKISPLGLINESARFSYEHILSKNISLGSEITFGYTGSFDEFGTPSDRLFGKVTFEPYLRYYFKGDGSMQGIYSQFMLKLGRFSYNQYVFAENELYDSQGNIINPTYDGGWRTTVRSIEVGGGLYLGFQKFLGRTNNIGLDINVGIQQWTFNRKKYVVDEGLRIVHGDGSYQFLIPEDGSEAKSHWINGPGFFLSSYFSIGFKF